MILYATKQTMNRCKLTPFDKLSDKFLCQRAQDVYVREHGDQLFEWGAKLFYFDRRKCIQVCNFASRFTLVLADVSVSDVQELNSMIALYLLNLYSDDAKMVALLERCFRNHPFSCFAELTDRRIISCLNYMQTVYLQDGYALRNYLKKNILWTRQLNYDINKKYLVSGKIRGKTEYFYPAERFAMLMKERYEIR